MLVPACAGAGEGAPNGGSDGETTAGADQPDGETTGAVPGGETTAETVGTVGLEGTSWRLVSLRGEGPGVPMSLRFGEDRVSGRAACNRFGGGYEATDGGSLEIGTLSLTRMACAGERGRLESRYVGAMAEATAYRATGDRLELLDGEGRALLVYEEARKGEGTG